MKVIDMFTKTNVTMDTNPAYGYYHYPLYTFHHLKIYSTIKAKFFRQWWNVLDVGADESIQNYDKPKY